MSTGGLGYQVLCDAGMAFLLTRTNSVVHRAPALNEEVALRTWHRGTRGAQFYRCYEFLDKAGEKLIESVTAFALVDVRDHRLLRPDAFEPYGLITQPERRNACPDPAKWKPPVDMAPVGDHVVRWSEVDWNGHLNNTCLLYTSPSGASPKGPLWVRFPPGVPRRRKQLDCLRRFLS